MGKRVELQVLKLIYGCSKTYIRLSPCTKLANTVINMTSINALLFRNET